MSNPALTTAGRANTGFTLVEMLLVMCLILILTSMLIPATILVRNHSRRAGAMGMVSNVEAAIATYLGDQHRLPPTEADNSLATNTGTSGAPRTLDLLVPEGLSLNSNMLSDPSDGLPLKLVDDWSRPCSYTADQVVAGAIAFNPPAPAAVMPTDWNPKKQVPFAYVWALGVPTSHGDVWDANPTNNLASWVYTHSQP